MPGRRGTAVPRLGLFRHRAVQSLAFGEHQTETKLRLDETPLSGVLIKENRPPRIALDASTDAKALSGLVKSRRLPCFGGLEKPTLRNRLIGLDSATLQEHHSEIVHRPRVPGLRGPAKQLERVSDIGVHSRALETAQPKIENRLDLAFLRRLPIKPHRALQIAREEFAFHANDAERVGGGGRTRVRRTLDPGETALRVGVDSLLPGEQQPSEIQRGLRVAPLRGAFEPARRAGRVLASSRSG